MAQGLSIKHNLPAYIKGSAVAFPDAGQWIQNEDIHSMIFGSDWKSVMTAKGLDPDYYYDQLGFKNRYWVHRPGAAIIHDELTSASLMEEAGKNALENAGCKPSEIDFVIAVTITSPRYSTSMGPYVAGRLNITAPALEMKSGCASNIFSILLAAQLIQSGARNVLIVGGETNTKTLPMHPRTAYAGGDAGAAVVVSKSLHDGVGILSAYVNSNGSFSGHMGVPGLLPPNQKDLDEQNYYLQYSDAAEDFLNKVWLETPAHLYERSGLRSEDVDCFIPHQVNRKRTEFAINAAGVSREKTVDVVAKYANCGSVSLLLAIDEARKNGMLVKDKKAMLIAAGGGISWGGLILQN